MRIFERDRYLGGDTPLTSNEFRDRLLHVVDQIEVRHDPLGGGVISVVAWGHGSFEFIADFDEAQDGVTPELIADWVRTLVRGTDMESKVRVVEYDGAAPADEVNP